MIEDLPPGVGLDLARERLTCLSFSFKQGKVEVLRSWSIGLTALDKHQETT
jgi:hypothetical protein